MKLEDRLARSLAEHLDALDVPSGDLPTVVAAGGRLRRRRTWTAAVGAAAAIAAVVGAGTVMVQRDGGEPVAVAPAGGTWDQVEPAPLTPRTGSLAAWTGTEALFVGGTTSDPCPPNADCKLADRYVADGAAYDPESGTWRRIADAPEPLAGYLPHAVVGDTMVVVTGGGEWLAYDSSDDAWTTLPAPPRTMNQSSVSSWDGRVYAVEGNGPVLVLDVATGSWSSLPASPYAPALGERSVTATPVGIVVTGVDSTAANDGREPSYLLAEVYDGASWQRLPRSDQLAAGDIWTWTGTRMVAPDLQCADGGEVDSYGSCLPYGGTLDPASGVWGPLPNAPVVGDSAWSVSAADDGNPMVAAWGYAYDDRRESWTRLPRPESTASDAPGSAVWAGDRLVAFGGVTWDGTDGVLSHDAWVWHR